MEGSHREESLRYLKYNDFSFFLKCGLWVNGRSFWKITENIGGGFENFDQKELEKAIELCPIEFCAHKC